MPPKRQQKRKRVEVEAEAEAHASEPDEEQEEAAREAEETKSASPVKKMRVAEPHVSEEVKASTESKAPVDAAGAVPKNDEKKEEKQEKQEEKTDEKSVVVKKATKEAIATQCLKENPQCGSFMLDEDFDAKLVTVDMGVLDNDLHIDAKYKTEPFKALFPVAQVGFAQTKVFGTWHTQGQDDEKMFVGKHEKYGPQKNKFESHEFTASLMCTWPDGTTNEPLRQSIRRWLHIWKTVFVPVFVDNFLELDSTKPKIPKGHFKEAFVVARAVHKNMPDPKPSLREFILASDEVMDVAYATCGLVPGNVNELLPGQTKKKKMEFHQIRKAIDLALAPGGDCSKLGLKTSKKVWNEVKNRPTLKDKTKLADYPPKSDFISESKVFTAFYDGQGYDPLDPPKDAQDKKKFLPRLAYDRLRITDIVGNPKPWSNMQLHPKATAALFAGLHVSNQGQASFRPEQFSVLDEGQPFVKQNKRNEPDLLHFSDEKKAEIMAKLGMPVIDKENVPRIAYKSSDVDVMFKALCSGAGAVPLAIENGSADGAPNSGRVQEVD
jgi:hypothetical protein